ncbi:MAG: peptidase S41 [Planctomycetaceae bacterium]|nr:peptidase S41 [Planctomycetaceae bacterium]
MQSKIDAFRFRSRWNFLFLLATAVLAPVVAHAQVRIPDAARNVAEVEQTLRVGDQLEDQRRWGEAVTHYEKALKENPGRREFEDRLVTSRFHYQIGRRYVDSSFLETVGTIGEQDALDLYGEVLLKVHAHYVQPPNWNLLLDRGLTAIEVAFSESAFAERHRLVVTTNPQPTFRQLHQSVATQRVYSRHDARQQAFELARTLQSGVGIPAPVSLLEFTCAAIGSLDDYSAFLTGNQLDDVLAQIEGNFVGLGIELKAEDEALQLVSVISGGPADQAGLKAGDRIVEVDGRSTREISTDAAADMLKGVEGSVVELVVLDASDAARRMRLKRMRVEVPSVDQVSIIDPDYGVGYVRITSFQKTTNSDMDAALWKLHREGMRSLIVDVRSNPGGLLTASVEVADKFVSQGSIVSTRGRSSAEDFDYKAHKVGTWRVPLIVLIDSDSASASEIFAGAIRDHRRGTLVGQRSYGKGSVQGIFPLSIANAGVRLTTAKFYSPAGHPISRRGVHPDVVVAMEDRQVVAKPVDDRLPIVDDQSDNTLAAAMQVARKQLSQRQR